MSFTWEHILYRFYGTDGALLYVGITNSIGSRFKDHAREKPWWFEVADCRVAFYADRASLARAEADSIAYEHPRYNIRQEMPVSRTARVPRPRPVAAPVLAAVPRQPGQGTMTDDEWDFLHYRGEYAGTAARGV